ncbi:hypothetical protein ABZ260_37850 [Streptosporangium sp. NPDC006013]|uniref:hypothetical protein n=1 Tax=Streptosporangium sp. NPDC006013 TaxID=3155596 RepID=UPI0033A0192C
MPVHGDIQVYVQSDVPMSAQSDTQASAQSDTQASARSDTQGSVHGDELQETAAFDEEDERSWREAGQGTEQTRGFLGSGWTGEPDDEKPRGGGKVLLTVAAGVVVAGLAGGWMLSSTVGSTPDAACPPGVNCATGERPQPYPADLPAEETEEATGPAVEQSVTPEPTTSYTQASRSPVPRPTPTLSTPPVKPAPEPVGERRDDGAKNVQSRPKASAEPVPSQTAQAPSRDSAPAENPAPSQKSAPAENPAPVENQAPAEDPKRGGGLLGWLF